jgi:dTDP-4-dehydrorhamnose 3,5-epimerase
LEFKIIEVNEKYSINLEKHDTKDVNTGHINGSLTVIYRDYDGIIENDLKMMYVSSIFPNEIKGPHLHTQRDSYFTCIHGKVVFIIKDADGKYTEIESSEEKPVLVRIPKGVSSAHVNPTKGIGRVLALANIAWRPDDNEMENVSFTDYDWQKWRLSKKEI